MFYFMYKYQEKLACTQMKRRLHVQTSNYAHVQCMHIYMYITCFGIQTKQIIKQFNTLRSTNSFLIAQIVDHVFQVPFFIAHTCRYM